MVLVQGLHLSRASCCRCFGSPPGVWYLCPFHWENNLCASWNILRDQNLSGQVCVWTLIMPINQCGNYCCANDIPMMLFPDVQTMGIPHTAFTILPNDISAFIWPPFYFLNCEFMVIEMEEQKCRKRLSLPAVFSLKHKGIFTRQFITWEMWSNTKCHTVRERALIFWSLKIVLSFSPSWTSSPEEAGTGCVVKIFDSYRITSVLAEYWSII